MDALWEDKGLPGPLRSREGSMSEPTEAEKAAAAATRDAALSVACPICKAPPGARCINLDSGWSSLTNGRPSNLVHRSRVSTWKVRMHHDRLA